MVARSVASFGAVALASLLAIVGLLRFVRTHSYRPFAIYRIVLGIAVIAIAMSRG